MIRLKLIFSFLFILFQFQSTESWSQVSTPEFRIFNKNQNSLGNYIFILDSKIMIIDNFGTPIYLKEFSSLVLNFNKQEDGYLYYFDSKYDEFYKLDSSYQIVDTLKIKNGYNLDYHSIVVKENGDIYLYGINYKVMDMSLIYPGGNEFATVIENVIQVLDKNKNLKFEWKSLDHIDILDTDTTFVDLTSNVVDYMHINSFDIDNQGDIYISARHLNSIIKINGISGDVIWTLGGKKNEFTMIGDNEFFSGQHSIKIIPDSKILLFDNGNVFHPSYSEGVEYLLDENLKTIEILRKFEVSPITRSTIMGNIQQFDDGNIIVGWGRNNQGLLLTEYDNDSNLVLRIESSNDKLYSYSITKINWKTNLFKSNRDTIDFGEVIYEEYATQPVIITNNSESPIELTSYSTHDTLFTILNEFPIVIPAKGNIELDIKFKPSKFGGNFFDIFTLNSDRTDNEGIQERIAIQICLKGYSQDIVSPFISSYPIHNSSNIPINTTIYIAFDEPVRSIDNSELTIDQIKNNIDFTKSDIAGEDVLFDIEYIAENKKIWLHLTSLLEYNENYVLSIYPYFEDYSDNLIDEKQIHFTTENSTLVNTISNDGIKIFPNPTLDKITISSSNQPINSVEICNFSGDIIQKLSELNNKDIVISINKQSSGIYILNVTLNDGEVFRKKIIKN